jgi:very-short-patch-repair endonuclease
MPVPCQRKAKPMSRRDGRMKEHARELRTEPTATEQLLWSRLRRRQIAGHKFRRQHVLGPYIVDFACLEQKLVIELDGGQHAEQRCYDERRTRWLEQRGFRVLKLLGQSGVCGDGGSLENHRGGPRRPPSLTLPRAARLTHRCPLAAGGGNDGAALCPGCIRGRKIHVWSHPNRSRPHSSTPFW